MGLLDNLKISKRKTDDDLSDSDRIKAQIMRGAIDEMASKSPAAGMMVANLSDYQLVKVAGVIVNLADALRAQTQSPDLLVLPSPHDDANGSDSED